MFFLSLIFVGLQLALPSQKTASIIIASLCIDHNMNIVPFVVIICKDYMIMRCNTICKTCPQAKLMVIIECQFRSVIITMKKKAM